MKAINVRLLEWLCFFSSFAFAGALCTQGFLALFSPILRSVRNGQKYSLECRTEARLVELTDELMIGFQPRLHCDELPGAMPILDNERFTMHWTNFHPSTTTMDSIAQLRVKAKGYVASMWNGEIDVHRSLNVQSSPVRHERVLG